MYWIKTHWSMCNNEHAPPIQHVYINKRHVFSVIHSEWNFHIGYKQKSEQHALEQMWQFTCNDQPENPRLNQKTKFFMSNHSQHDNTSRHMVFKNDSKFVIMWWLTSLSAIGGWSVLVVGGYTESGQELLVADQPRVVEVISQPQPVKTADLLP